MELTRNTFKTIILLSFIVLFMGFGIETFLFFNNYEVLEEKLHQGYISQLISSDVYFLIFVFILFTHLISLVLLYLFKPIGRPIYTASYILIIIGIMLSGDWIQYSLTYPFEILEAFLEIFILYLIYLTPLKNEFAK